MSPKRGCSFVGCDRPLQGLTYCNSHQRQYNRGTGTVKINSHRNGPQCNVPECGKKPQALGLCHNHYMSAVKFREAQDGDKQCSFSGCILIHYAKGFCYHHYAASRSFAYSKYVGQYLASPRNEG